MVSFHNNDNVDFSCWQWSVLRWFLYFLTCVTVVIYLGYGSYFSVIILFMQYSILVTLVFYFG